MVWGDVLARAWAVSLLPPSMHALVPRLATPHVNRRDALFVPLAYPTINLAKGDGGDPAFQGGQGLPL